MKKQELLKIMDENLMEKLFGFCYARTGDSQEARELCSDIVFELVNAANTEGDIENPYGFLWRIARNTYYDFANKKRRNSDIMYQGDPEEIFPLLAHEDGEENGEDDSEALLDAVYCQIAFLTKAYREVMVLFYLDGLSTAEIAVRQNTSETAIRQRLFAARRKIQSEVEEMKGISPKPVILDPIEYCIYGMGNPAWGDPRDVCTKQFSRHLVWLCRKRSITPAEAAEQLHVPAVYVEEELEALRKGANGQYGLVRRLDNGKGANGIHATGRYAINFPLFDREEVRQLRSVYMEQVPAFCRIVTDFVEAQREEYLAFPYLNRDRDWNLILWQQVYMMPSVFARCVARILAERYFAHVEEVERPFSVYGYVEDGEDFGTGCDCVEAEDDIYGCWYVENIYNKWIEGHFFCWYHLEDNQELRLALKALQGLALDSLSEAEKEYAARALECGYLYREGEMLYTKILVCSRKDRERLFHVTEGLADGCLEKCAETVAEKLSNLIRRFLPGYLLGEWRLVNDLAYEPVVLNALLESLVEKGILVPPENGIGAEGCWMTVESF
nr:RNA polymerase sigma factor [uncultured Acetatifactor sp.]